ncbi:MAG: DUF1801 domain-containing protein [Flavisolibacter sp.]
MQSSGKKFKTVKEYFDLVSPAAKKLLTELRKTIKKAAPDAEEVVSYNMPAFKFHGMLVYYAAFKEHIGFYPPSSGINAFKEELSDYEVSKGTIRFSIKNKIPYALITKIVRFRVIENLKNKKAG